MDMKKVLVAALVTLVPLLIAWGTWTTGRSYRTYVLESDLGKIVSELSKTDGKIDKLIGKVDDGFSKLNDKIDKNQEITNTEIIEIWKSKQTIAVIKK